MGRTLFNLMDSNPNNPLATGAAGDIRAFAFIDPTSKVDSQGPVVTGTAGTAPYYNDPALPYDTYKATDVLLVDKYPGKTGLNLTNDLKVLDCLKCTLFRLRLWWLRVI